jgi:glucokinase
MSGGHRTIGIDLGGTKVLAVLVEDGQIIAREKRATPRTGTPENVLDTLVTAVQRIDPDGSVERIGIGVPGPVVPGTGVLPAAPNLPNWDHDVPVAQLMSERLDGRNVVVGNDVNLGTLAEHRLGAGRGVDDLLGVFVGTGVGAGLVLDGRLRQGHRGLAGEIGHTFVAFADFVHGGGSGRGELEDYAGRAALERRVLTANPDRAETLLGFRRGGRLKSKGWVDALEREDPLARDLVDQAASALAASIASAVALLDLELVVLGGGFAGRLGEPFRRQVEGEVHKRAFAGASAAVVHAQLGDVAGALGAALMVDEP